MGFLVFDIVGENEGTISLLAVEQKLRNHGIGSLLVSEAIQRFHFRINTVTLRVRVSNDPAIKVYQRNGFNIEKLIPNYYGKDQDAYLMRKDLSENRLRK